MVRPSQEEFDKFVSIIESGANFQNGFGWGGAKLKYGGYYGHGTIQGTTLSIDADKRTN